MLYYCPKFEEIQNKNNFLKKKISISNKLNILVIQCFFCLIFIETVGYIQIMYFNIHYTRIKIQIDYKKL